MHNTKLLTLLRTLKEEELKAFSKYLNALYGKHKAAMTLFQHLKKYQSTDYNHKRLDKAYIQTKVLKTNNERRVSNEASQLYDWLNEFLVWRRIKSEDYKIRYQQILLEEYRERRIEKFVDRLLPSIEEQYAKSIKTTQDYLNEIEMYHQAYFGRFEERTVVDSTIFNKGLQALQQAYYIYILKYACEAKIRQGVVRENLKEITIPDEIEPFSLVAKMFQLLHQLYEGESLDSFKEVQIFYKKNYAELPIDEQRFTVVALINWGGKLMRKGRIDLASPLLDLYRFGLDIGILTKGVFLTSMMMNNIVSLAISIQKFDIAREIVNKYGDFLNPETGLETKRLARAQIYFAEGHIANAKQLFDYKYKYPLHDIKAKAFSICCMFESGEDYEIISNKCKAFSQYLGRKNTLNQGYALGFRNFLSILRKLIDKTEPKDKIEADLNNRNPIYLKSWLLVKLNTYRAIYA